MKKKSKTAVYIVAFIILFVLSFIYKFILSGDISLPLLNTGESETTVTETVISETTEASEEINNISVYLCGAVNSPGVYEVASGTILNDVIELAGGVREDAAVNRIDFVYVLENNQSIYIPNYEEVENGTYSGIYFLNSEAETGDGSQTSGLVNINTASEEELCGLPGIGEVTALSIISYREENPFTSIEDIMNVSGIGEGKFDKISGLICV